MPVFRGYFKVLRAALPSMLINVVIFLGLTLLFSFTATPAGPLRFSQTQTPIAVINRDGESELTRGLISYLARTNRVLDYPDDPERLQDALFFRNVECVAFIPDGFTAAMLQGDGARLEKVAAPDARSSQYVEIAIDRYLNTVRRYLQCGQPDDWAKLLAQVEADLAVETPVLLSGTDQAVARSFNHYFNYIAYTQLALVMLGVTSVMLAFNRADVQQRNLCAPLSRRRFNLQLAAGHALFALGTWLLLLAFALAVYRAELLSSGLLGLLGLNTLLFALICISLGLLVGSLVKSANAQTAVVNMLTLGMSFLSGVFVPQSLISPTVISCSKFLPSYWYVRANDAICAAEQLSGANLASVHAAMWMQLGFAVAIFSITLLLGKQRPLTG